jgi:hypothetical protein
MLKIRTRIVGRANVNTDGSMMIRIPTTASMIVLLDEALDVVNRAHAFLKLVPRI